MCTSTNAARRVQGKMEIVVGSYPHREVSFFEVACFAGIANTTACLALLIVLQCTLLCYPNKIQRHHTLLSGDFVKWRTFVVWVFQKLDKNDSYLSNVLRTNEARFTLRGSVNSHNSRNWANEDPTAWSTRKPRLGVDLTASTVIGFFFWENAWFWF